VTALRRRDQGLRHCRLHDECASGSPDLPSTGRLAVLLERRTAGERNRVGDQLGALRGPARRRTAAVADRIIRKVDRSRNVQIPTAAERIRAILDVRRAGVALLEKSQPGSRARRRRGDIDISVAGNTDGAWISGGVATSTRPLKYQCDPAGGLQRAACHTQISSTRENVDAGVQREDRVAAVGVHRNVFAKDPSTVGRDTSARIRVGQLRIIIAGRVRGGNRHIGVRVIDRIDACKEAVCCCEAGGLIRSADDITGQGGELSVVTHAQRPELQWRIVVKRATGEVQVDAAAQLDVDDARAAQRENAALVSGFGVRQRHGAARDRRTGRHEQRREQWGLGLGDDNLNVAVASGKRRIGTERDGAGG
jgi:hypothetical protein